MNRNDTQMSSSAQHVSNFNHIHILCETAAYGAIKLKANHGRIREKETFMFLKMLCEKEKKKEKAISINIKIYLSFVFMRCIVLHLRFNSSLYVALSLSHSFPICVTVN